MKKIDEIEKKCNDNGITLTELFRVAGVPHSTVQNWRRKEPEAFEKLEKLNTTLEKLIAEKTE